MANSFKSFQSTSVTTETTAYTGPSSTETTIIGMSVANTSSGSITVDVKLNTAYMVKAAPVPVGSALVVVGGDQKVVVEATDTIKVTCTGTADVITSVLEIT
jgi:hypothetical protein